MVDLTWFRKHISASSYRSLANGSTWPESRRIGFVDRHPSQTEQAT